MSRIYLFNGIGYLVSSVSTIIHMFGQLHESIGTTSSCRELPRYFLAFSMHSTWTFGAAIRFVAKNISARVCATTWAFFGIVALAYHFRHHALSFSQTKQHHDGYEAFAMQPNVILKGWRFLLECKNFGHVCRNGCEQIVLHTAKCSLICLHRLSFSVLHCLIVRANKLN